MTKNKVLSIMLIAVTLLSVCFSFVISASAESPNLLEMYNYNPTFDRENTVWKTLENAKIERYQDSSDGDGWCLKVSQRDSDYSVPSLMGDDALKIFTQQGSGTYYYSFYVKCAQSGQKVYMRPQFQLIYGGTYSADAMSEGTIKGKWPYGNKKEGFYVDSESWTKVEMTVTVNKYNENLLLGEAKLYGSQADFIGTDGVGGVNAYDLLFDNFTLVKKTGNWVYVNMQNNPTPTPVSRPYPSETVDPNEDQLLPMPTLTAAPQITQTAKPQTTAEPTVIPEKQEIDKWNGLEIALDMFSWNKPTDAELGVTHYFDNKTRVINWVLVALVLMAIAAIVYAIIPAKKLACKEENTEIAKDQAKEQNVLE